jgi:hypothetical protein
MKMKNMCESEKEQKEPQSLEPGPLYILWTAIVRKNHTARIFNIFKKIVVYVTVKRSLFFVFLIAFLKFQ